MSLGSLARRDERHMLDECTIVRPARSSTYDPGTLATTADAPATVYAGKCRVRPFRLSDLVVEAGDQPVTLRRYAVTLPAAAVDIEISDEVFVTVSRDPRIIGRRLRVVFTDVDTYLTTRHLQVEDAETP